MWKPGQIVTIKHKKYRVKRCYDHSCDHINTPACIYCDFCDKESYETPCSTLCILQTPTYPYMTESEGRKIPNHCYLELIPCGNQVK